jgi:SAM-dependent methyltransferase
MSPESSAYGEDLAFIHDQGYAAFAQSSAPELLQILRDAGHRRGTIVDLGCGSGIWAAELLRAGYRPIGVDQSPAFLDLARSRLPEGEFHLGSFVDVGFPSCVAVTALGEVLGYLFDERNDLELLDSLFARVFHALAPGGLFIFDVCLLDLDRGRKPSYREGDGWSCMVAIEHDDERNQLLRHIVTIRRVGQDYRRSEETHRVQLFDGKELLAMLRDTGFEAQCVERFGAFPMLPGRAGFIARKPGIAPLSPLGRGAGGEG